MFGISSFEFLVILLAALVVVGPDKMPGLIRRFTKLVSAFRRMKTDFHRTVNLELANLELAEQARKNHREAETAPADAPPVPAADPMAGGPAPEGEPTPLNPDERQ